MQLDYPHSVTNNVDCTDCHVASEIDFLNPAWKSPTPANLDDTPFNNFCWSCHNDGPAQYVNTHSSYAIGTERYGQWSIECRTCHWPHHLVQYRTSGAASYLASGTSSGVTSNTLSVSGAPWTVDQFQGMVLIPDLSQDLFNYKILSNTANTITITGTMDAGISSGASFAIVYGKLVKSTIATPNSGNKEVMFFNNQGANSFADGDATYNGPCEVCHTQTNHFRNDGLAGDQNHENIDGSPKGGANCVGECHLHRNGFAHGQGSGGSSCGDASSCHGLQKSHPTHVGPIVNADCSACHDTTSFPKFRDGLDLANTTACDNCHSADGVSSAKANFATPGAWLTSAGIEGYCGSCHDDTPGNSGYDGSGNPAGNIVGNKIDYGFYVTGHGKTGSNYGKLTWQDTAGVGNPPAGRDCVDCHDLDSAHFNSPVSRLKAGFENDVNNSNCNQCHVPNGNPVAAVAAPIFYTNYADYQNSAHSTEKCTNCHEIHGGSGPFEAMTKGDRQGLCYQCHTDPGSGGIQNDALANNRPGGHSSADDIEEAFMKTTKHDLGAQFNVSGKTYKLECTSCHNVHIVTGKYWDAEQGKSPVTRFPGNAAGFSYTEPWGDEPGEKMNDFAALGSGTGGWDVSTARGGSMTADQPAVYQPPRQGEGYDGFEFGGDVLPDYPTFCLDCHSSQVSAAIYPISWGQLSPQECNTSGTPYQRVLCEPPHGLSSANSPTWTNDQYSTDNDGESINYGANDNPNPIFNVEYVSLGRGNGHFMQWPYETADRSAGINYVLSCTDCHEAHGSDRGAMMRERFNVTPNGDCGTGTNSDPDGENCGDGSNWRNFCGGCHHFQGGQHFAAAQCGSATCHTSNSIHRIRNVMQSPDTRLQLTRDDEAGLYQRPDFTPDILQVLGDANSAVLTVTFKTGVWGNKDLNAAITDPNIFIMTDANGDNPRSITGVIHTAGQNTATLTMSAALYPADLGADLLGLRRESVWAYYAGGYTNPGTLQTIQAGPVPAGPWPATIQATVSDADGDGVPDDVDNCVNVYNADQANNDGDTVGDACDNCTLLDNENQLDTNGDGYGNRCDGDLNNDGSTSFLDLGIFKASFGKNSSDPNWISAGYIHADLDGNGSVSFLDLGIFKSLFGKPPGPAGTLP